jgi:hypothetical protein
MTQIWPGTVSYLSSTRHSSAINQSACLFDAAKCGKNLGVAQSRV